jgi:hypothetical protein
LYGLLPGETLQALQQRLLTDQSIAFVYVNFEKVTDLALLLEDKDHIEFVVPEPSYLLQIFDMLEEEMAVEVTVTRLEPLGEKQFTPPGVGLDWILRQIPDGYFLVALLVNGQEVTKETFRAGAGDVIIAVLDMDVEAA